MRRNGIAAAAAPACPSRSPAGAEQLAAAVGQDPAGQQADHPYAARAALVGHVLGDAGQPGPQAVGDAEVRRSASGPRWRAPARSRRRRPSAAPITARRPDRAEEHGLERLPPLLVGGRRRRVPRRRPADRDQRAVEPAERATAPRRRAAPASPGRRGRRRRPTARRPPSRRDRVVDGGPVARGDDHPGAVGDQALRGGEAQAAGGAGEDVDAVGEPEIHDAEPYRRDHRQPDGGRRGAGDGVRRGASRRTPQAASRSASSAAAAPDSGAGDAREVPAVAQRAVGGRPSAQAANAACHSAPSDGREHAATCRATSPARLRSSAVRATPDQPRVEAGRHRRAGHERRHQRGLPRGERRSCDRRVAGRRRRSRPARRAGRRPAGSRRRAPAAAPAGGAARTAR